MKDNDGLPYKFFNYTDIGIKCFSSDNLNMKYRIIFIVIIIYLLCVLGSFFLFLPSLFCYVPWEGSEEIDMEFKFWNKCT